MDQPEGPTLSKDKTEKENKRPLSEIENGLKKLWVV